MYGKVGNLLVISGLAGSGKNALIDTLKKKYKVHAIPSSHSFMVNTLPNIEVSEEDNIVKLEYYFTLDKRCSMLASSALKDNSYVVADSDFVASISYNYALSKTKNNKDIFAWTIEKYVDAIENLEFAIPDICLYLDVPFEERIKKVKQNQSNYFEKIALTQDFSRYATQMNKNILKNFNAIILNYENPIGVDEIFALIDARLKNYVPNYNQERRILVNFLKGITW